MNANLTATQAENLDDAEIQALALDDAGRQVALIEDGKQQCSCSDSCSGRTTRFFSQGHDARMVTRLLAEVTEGRKTTAEAFAEITKRGGTERLQLKLDAAVANAAKPKKSRKAKAAKSAPIETFQLEDFTLASMPLATEPRVTAKVSRWEYNGEIVTYQIVEDGKISKGDTVLIFEYKDKKGDLRQTSSYKRVKVDEEFEAAAPADEAPVLVSLRGDAAAEAAKEEVAELLPIEIPAALAGVIGPRRTTNSGDPIPF